jgi:hypothetical protein
MGKPQLAWGLIILGLVIIVLSAFADALGYGQQPGFGWKQTLGVVIGVALVLGGFYWRRQLSAYRSA